jgi:hypothetical protein
VPETVEAWKNYRLLQETEDSGPLRYNANEIGIFFNLKPNKAFTFRDSFVMVVYNLNSGTPHVQC